MAGIEVLAGLGFMASELFKYNRENYEFDQDQRFEREECRLKMQVERFTLFREDIRDLVELTVGKMDLYHLIGALFLKMVVLYFAVGFFVKPVPPFMLSLYYVSNASAWIWLMLAIWLAMHASISSHSYGTRLLTRFVRLPIPGSAQINVLNARYADFEKQGLQMWRVPFLQRQANAWGQRNAIGSFSADVPQLMGEDGKAKPKPKSKGGSQSSRDAPAAVDHANQDWLGSGEYAYGGFKDIAGREAEMLRAVEFRTHRHVQLFRQLQSQWQCFDAYARVAMSLGVRAMIQSLSYYLMGLCLIDQQAPYVAYALVMSLQAMATCLYVMDIHGLPCYGNLDLSMLGAAPCVLALIQLSVADRTEEGILMDDNRYMIAVACFPLEICWMHLSIWAASPTDRENALPRHFRSVLFMDVFAEVDDPMETDPRTGLRKLDANERSELEKQAEAADAALYDANCALRRWEAAPYDALSREQQKILRQASKELDRWIEALSNELSIRKVMGLAQDQVARKPWEQLTTAEREEDPFVGSVLGPFVQFTGHGTEARYFYEPETREYMYEPLPGDRIVFTIQQAVDVVREFADEVERVCAVGGRPTDTRSRKSVTEGGGGDADSSGDDDDEDGDSPLTRARSENTLTSRTRSGTSGDAIQRAEDQLRPNRLPWQLVRISGRAIQLVWVFVFVMMVLNFTETFVVDWQGPPVRGSIARRLGFALSGPRLPPLAAEPADPAAVAAAMGGAAAPPWPCECPFFRPTGLSCIPDGTLLGLPATAAGPQLLVNDPFAVYRAGLLNTSADGGPGMEELPKEHFPKGSVLVCSAALQNSGGAPPRCLVAAATARGIAFRPLPGAVGDDAAPGAFELEWEAEPWTIFAGALVSCAAAVRPQGARGNLTGAGVEELGGCVLLAGSPGAGRLQTALAPLPPPPRHGEAAAAARPRPRRRYLAVANELRSEDDDDLSGDLGVVAGAFDSRVVAVSVAAGSGRLAAIDAGGVVAAWDLLGGPARPLGRWRLRAPQEIAAAGGFQAAGMCEDQATGDLLIAGRRLGASSALAPAADAAAEPSSSARPALLRASAAQLQHHTGSDEPAAASAAAAAVL